MGFSFRSVFEVHLPKVWDMFVSVSWGVLVAVFVIRVLLLGV